MFGSRGSFRTAAVVAIHDILRDTLQIPDPDRALTPSDTLLIGGLPRRLEALARLR